jgi:acyl carrier protein
MQDIVKRIANVTAEVLKTDPSRISENSRFVEDLGAESVQSMELIAAFEEEFEIEMEQDAALSIKTVGDAAKFIKEYL